MSLNEIRNFLCIKARHFLSLVLKIVDIIDWNVVVAETVVAVEAIDKEYLQKMHLKLKQHEPKK
jgi:hypothetical protein